MAEKWSAHFDSGAPVDEIKAENVRRNDNAGQKETSWFAFVCFVNGLSGPR
jgi:hypothetical protein